MYDDNCDIDNDIPEVTLLWSHLNRNQVGGKTFSTASDAGAGVSRRTSGCAKSSRPEAWERRSRTVAIK